MFKLYFTDCQNDFFEGGSLAVPGSNIIKSNIAKLVDFAMNYDIPIIGSQDAHTKNDPEFKVFPPHCIKGTSGQDNIREVRFPDKFLQTVPARKMVPIDANTPQIMFEKMTYDIFDENLGNVNLLPYLKGTHTTSLIVAGVATDICVLAAVKGLIQNGFEVLLVIDAIKGLDNEYTAIQEMENNGAQIVKTEYVIDENGLFDFPEEV